MSKIPAAVAYYRPDCQAISKARIMLTENSTFSSIYNEVNREAKISVSEEIRDPKQFRNFHQNLNQTKRDLSCNSGEVDRIVAAMKLEHGKSFILNVTITSILRSICIHW